MSDKPIWKLIHHTRGFCRLWQDTVSGRFSLSDYSGKNPEDTDDFRMHGILWLDTDAPLTAAGMHKSTQLFLTRLESQRTGARDLTASVDMGFARALSALTGQPLVMEHDGVAFEITPMRSREPLPLQTLATDAEAVQNAVNIAGVAGLLQRVHAQLQRRLGSTNDASTHVITRAIVSKIMSMVPVRSTDAWDDPVMVASDWDDLGRLARGELSSVEAMGETVARKGV